jgi:hypothetical protein
MKNAKMKISAMQTIIFALTICVSNVGAQSDNPGTQSDNPEILTGNMENSSSNSESQFLGAPLLPIRVSWENKLSEFFTRTDQPIHEGVDCSLIEQHSKDCPYIYHFPNSGNPFLIAIHQENLQGWGNVWVTRPVNKPDGPFRIPGYSLETSEAIFHDLWDVQGQAYEYVLPIHSHFPNRVAYSELVAPCTYIGSDIPPVKIAAFGGKMSIMPEVYTNPESPELATRDEPFYGFVGSLLVAMHYTEGRIIIRSARMSVPIFEIVDELELIHGLWMSGQVSTDTIIAVMPDCSEEPREYQLWRLEG